MILNKVREKFLRFFKNISEFNEAILFIKSLNEIDESIKLSPYELKRLKIIIYKLSKSIPLPYIIKRKFFYKNYFYVNKHVLIPRYETECIVNYINNLNFDAKNVLDLCTGSGCIGLSLDLKNDAKLYLSDNSSRAIKVAKINSKIINKKCFFIRQNFINNSIKKALKFNMIVCNPPYIDKDDVSVDKSVIKFEPHNALFAKDEGLFFYKKLEESFESVVDTGNKFYVIVEFGWLQKELISKIFHEKSLKYKIEFKKDLSNNWRFFVITNK